LPLRRQRRANGRFLTLLTSWANLYLGLLVRKIQGGQKVLHRNIAEHLVAEAHGGGKPVS